MAIITIGFLKALLGFQQAKRGYIEGLHEIYVM